MLLCAIPIVWAAITDFRKRIIPDWTWIAVLLIGGVSAFLFNTPYIPLLERILGLLLPGLSLLFLAVKYGGVGGGDIKLTAAMGFYFGLYGILAILFFCASSRLHLCESGQAKEHPAGGILMRRFFRLCWSFPYCIMECFLIYHRCCNRCIQ